MRNSGFVSVGHILASKPAESHQETLRHFCTVVFCNVDDAHIHKSSGFWRFDQFFRSVPVSVESFAQFFGGLLRKHDSDAFQLQLELERLAWDMVKFDFDRFTCPVMPRKSLFHLFCLFNRFADFQRVPMSLPESALCFLLKELKLPFADGDEHDQDLDQWTLPRLLQFVCSDRTKRHFQPRLLKRLYDTYVRDVLKEGRLRCRVAGSTAKSTRVVSVTSRELVVYDDCDLDAPAESEPTGRILHRLPLIDAETKVCKARGGKQLLQVLASDGGSGKAGSKPNVELVFDASTENYDLFAWNQAVQEATFSTQANQDRLSKAHLRLGFSTDVRRGEDQRRLSSHSSPPEAAEPKEVEEEAGVPRAAPRHLPVPAPRAINRSSSELLLPSLIKRKQKRSSPQTKERRMSPLALPPAPAFLVPGRKKTLDLTELRQGLDDKEARISSGSETAETWRPLRKDSFVASRAY